MKPGMTELQTRTELEGILQQSIASDVKQTTKPETIPHLGLASASKGLNELRRDFSRPLFVLMTVVGLVLLIACANVANLMLVRADTRRREIAVRLAIGAGRGRLVRQLFTESLLLAALGGAIGLLMAFSGVNLLLGFIASGPESITLSVTPDVRVLGFTIALSLLTGIVFSLSPALGSMRVDLTPALKEGGRDQAMGAANRHSWFSGKSLVITQVSLSIVLLVGAGLFVRTLAKIKNVSLGFNPQNILLFGIDPAQDGYKDQRLLDFYQDLSRRIGALPGVRSVGLSVLTLVSGGNSFLRTRLEDQGGHLNNSERTGANYNWVGPGFFKAMGIPLVLGRIFSETETSVQPKVALVNEAFVRRFLANRNPIGQRFAAGDREGIEIVGIVGNAKYADLTQEVPPTVYLSYLQFPGDLNPMHFEVRTVGDPTEIVAEVRRVVRDIDTRLALYDVKTQTEQINQALFQERLFARLTSFFGVLAALLASVGIYGVMAFIVSRRAHEFGVRMALGAGPKRIVRQLLTESVLLSGAGAALGILFANWGAEALASFISSNSDSPIVINARPDAMVLVSTAGVALLTGILFGLAPAFRGYRINVAPALKENATTSVALRKVWPRQLTGYCSGRTFGCRAHKCGLAGADACQSQKC
jgi:predicted permease